MQGYNLKYFLTLKRYKKILSKTLRGISWVSDAYFRKYFFDNKVKLGVSPLVNWSKFGYDFAVVLIELNDISSYQEIIELLKTRDEVRRIRLSYDNSTSLIVDIAYKNLSTVDFLVRNLSENKIIKTVTIMNIIRYEEKTELPLL